MNQSGVQKTTGVSRTQILANVGMQSSVGCIMSEANAVTVNGRKVHKAGTPILVNLKDLNGTVAVLSDGTNEFNAVLLHEVDVTTGNANATALVFGFVNLNRLESDVVAKITTASGSANATKLLTFMKV